MKLTCVRCLAFTMAIMLIITNGLAFSVRAAEPTLTEILNTLGFTNVELSSVETFEPGTYNVTLYAEFAAYNGSNELSYYAVGSLMYSLLFSGPEGMFGYVSPPITKTFLIPEQFGLSMYTPEDHRYFTENFLNLDGQNHSKVYLNLDNPNMYLIGFENKYGTYDRDYQDLVFSLEKTRANIVTAADFTYSPPSPKMVEDVTFDASSSNGTIVEFMWDFGDGNALNTTYPIVVHQFTGFGLFNITLRVIDSDGGSDTTWQLITVAGYPTASFIYSPSEPHALEEVAFDASGSQPSGGSIVGYAWDFGDGSGNSTSASTVKHTYVSPGDCNVTLTVTDSEGLSETVLEMITVLPGVQHDIALVNVTTNTPHEYAGRTVNITLTARNNGEVIESFDLKAYRNSTLIGMIHVIDLGTGEEIIVIIPWNTSYLIAGQSWTIKGEAAVVGDITPADNVLVDGQVYIKMIGDVNADGIVDIFDVAAGAVAFGSVEGDPKWEPQADIAAEFGLVDVLDLVAIVLHLGEVVEPGA